MSVSGLKKSLTIMSLFAAVAFAGTPAIAQGGVLKEELKKPGLAGFMQGFPQIDPKYNPTHLKKALTDACSLSDKDFAAMPDTSTMDNNALGESLMHTCTVMHDALHGKVQDQNFAAGLNQIIHGSEYNDQSFHHACMGASEPVTAEAAPQAPEASIQATPEQIKETCDRLVKGVGEVKFPGLIFLFKGDAKNVTGYDSQGMAETFSKACGAPMTEALQSVASPVAPSAFDPKGSFVQSMVTACDTLAAMIEDESEAGHVGMNDILSRDEGMGYRVFNYACPSALKGTAPL